MWKSDRKERIMQQVRIAVLTLKPGTADEVIRRAKAEVAPRLHGEAGFVAYGLVKTGDTTVISLSIWGLEDQATAAGELVERWEQESFGPPVDAVESHIGRLEFFWDLGTIGR